MNSLAYHESELAIALDASHPAHINPPAPPTGAVVLDIGCGAGQTLLAALPGRFALGVDIDIDALRIGRQWSQGAQFVCARAEAIPFPDAHFDAIWARVSLAYTNIEHSLNELRRLLKLGGTLWIVLHPMSVPWQSAREGGLKAWLFFAYITLNSGLFHLTGKMFPLAGRYESFQIAASMLRELRRRGFTNIRIKQGHHFLITASLA